MGPKKNNASMSLNDFSNANIRNTIISLNSDTDIKSVRQETKLPATVYEARAQAEATPKRRQIEQAIITDGGKKFKADNVVQRQTVSDAPDASTGEQTQGGDEQGDGEQTEIVFSVDGQEFRVERTLLEQKAATLAAMYDTDEADGGTTKFEVEEVAPEVFGALIDFIKTDQIEDKYFEGNLVALHVAADKVND